MAARSLAWRCDARLLLLLLLLLPPPPLHKMRCYAMPLKCARPPPYARQPSV